MVKKVGTWWIRDGLDDRRVEAEGFGEVLDLLSSFDWSQNHGESDFLEKDFVETANYTEKIDQVDIMFKCTHGVYDPDVPSTYGHAFATWTGDVETSDSIDWGKADLDHFSSHACRLLYHSSSNSVGRWIPAFKRLHYMLGFHTPSYSGTNQRKRGSKFAVYAALHLFFPWFFSGYTLRTAWKKANEEVEGSSVQWAYLRANGKTDSGAWVDTYNEKLRTTEPKDPVKNRSFYTAKGSC